MSIIEAIILGIIQGLTEFLPVSSSGHIELGKAILSVETEEDLLFSLLVHLATVLAIFIIFRKDIFSLLKALFSFKWNEKTKYIAMILLSALPVMLVGLLFKSELEALFQGRVLLVGCMLLLNGFILQLSRLEKPETKPLTFSKVLVIGLAQAFAVLPGISRSGSTIATALACGISREEAARFSFLIVLIPIVGASFLELLDFSSIVNFNQQIIPYSAGFIAAFISGLFACTLMLKIVKKGGITVFSIYCWLAGLIAIAWSFMS
ncbi:UNVERIFIED_CONTAM: hypothetical protein GTU68_002039 [Idotea baltica]|nr:hypothetical protein [Idotea baltica]